MQEITQKHTQDLLSMALQQDNQASGLLALTEHIVGLRRLDVKENNKAWCRIAPHVLARLAISEHEFEDLRDQMFALYDQS